MDGGVSAGWSPGEDESGERVAGGVEATLPEGTGVPHSLQYLLPAGSGVEQFWQTGLSISRLAPISAVRLRLGPGNYPEVETYAISDDAVRFVSARADPSLTALGRTVYDSVPRWTAPVAPRSWLWNGCFFPRTRTTERVANPSRACLSSKSKVRTPPRRVEAFAH